MCQVNAHGDTKKNCGCELKSEMEALSKEELLMRLKAYKKNLESELLIVKGKLGGADPEERR